MSFAVRIAAGAHNDRELVVALLAEYLGDPRSAAEARHRWLHLENPHGESIVALAFDAASGEVAGVNSVFPRRMVRHDGPELLGGLGGDMFVRPAFRRRGLGTLLHRAAQIEMQARGISLMFGTPMAANVTPLKSSGSSIADRTVRLIRPTDPRLLGLRGSLASAARILLAPRAANARLEPMGPLDRRVDEAWQAMRPELRLATVRDAAFYTWRFLRSPTGVQRPFVVVDDRGRTLGACALERSGDRLRVIDVVAPARAWGRVLAAAYRFAPDAAAIELKLGEADARPRMLLRHGFVVREAKAMSVWVDKAAFFDGRAPTGLYFTLAECDIDHA